MFLQLLREVVARFLVGEVEPVLVDQHLLVLEPLLPRFLRHVPEYALAELAGIGREIEPLGLTPELDALDHARHEWTPKGPPSQARRPVCPVYTTLHMIYHATPRWTQRKLACKACQGPSQQQGAEFSRRRFARAERRATRSRKIARAEVFQSPSPPPSPIKGEGVFGPGGARTCLTHDVTHTGPTNRRRRRDA